MDPDTYIIVVWILKKYVCFTDVWHQRRQSCYNRWCKNVSKKIATRIYQRKLLWTPKIAKNLHKIYIIFVNIWIITLKMANFKGWFFFRKYTLQNVTFFRYFQPLWKKWNFACIFKKFRFFRITKAQFQLQGWPLRDEDLDQRVKSCFNQVWILWIKKIRLEFLWLSERSERNHSLLW